MIIADKPGNELERLQTLNRYEILDSEFESAYDDLTEIASIICNTPIAAISLIDADRQWFKSKIGLRKNETSRDIAFCAHAILHDNLFVVSDAAADERFFDNPLVTGEPNIRFYAGAPLITHDGYALGTICTMDHVPREISEDQTKALKNLAKQVIYLFELRHSNLMLTKSSNKLNKTLAKKDKLFSIISHDLKSPFTGILGLSEILKSDYESLSQVEIEEVVNGIHSASTDVLNLVENLLNWSLLERDLFKYNDEKFDLNEIIKNNYSILKGNAAFKKIKININSEPELWVSADKTMINSVVQNLIGNAIKFTPENKTINISAVKSKGEIKTIVEDTGAGMDEDTIQQLFNKNINNSLPGTRGEKGTGLGLILIKEFIEKNNGSLKIESEFGKGSKFTFSLPESNL